MENYFIEARYLRFLEVQNTFDIERLAEFYSEDVEYSNHSDIYPSACPQKI